MCRAIEWSVENGIRDEMINNIWQILCVIKSMEIIRRYFGPIASVGSPETAYELHKELALMVANQCDEEIKKIDEYWGVY